jgi:hypothetical protein
MKLKYSFYIISGLLKIVRWSTLSALFLLLALNAYADDGVPVGFTRDYAEALLNEAVNTNTLFSSQSLISNGSFLQRRVGQPDIQYESFRLPVELSLAESSDGVRPFVTTGFGLLKVTGGAAPLEGGGQNDFSVTRLFTLSSGFGAYIDILKGLSIAPVFALSYSHLNNRYDFNNGFSQGVLSQQYSDFYNWSLDLFTYTPELRVLYELKFDCGEFRYMLRASQLFNDSFDSGSADVKINSSSGLVSNRVEFEREIGVLADSTAMSVQPFFQWGNISGRAASGLNLVNLFEVGADLIFKLNKRFGPLSELYVGSSYVSADNFEGYHLGLGGHF